MEINLINSQECEKYETLLNNQWIKGEITREIREYFEIDKNEHTKYQNLWDAVKTVLRGKFIVCTLKKKKELKSVT